MSSTPLFVLMSRAKAEHYLFTQQLSFQQWNALAQNAALRTWQTASR